MRARVSSGTAASASRVGPEEDEDEDAKRVSNVYTELCYISFKVRLRPRTTTTTKRKRAPFGWFLRFRLSCHYLVLLVFGIRFKTDYNRIFHEHPGFSYTVALSWNSVWWRKPYGRVTKKMFGLVLSGNVFPRVDERIQEARTQPDRTRRKTRPRFCCCCCCRICCSLSSIFVPSCSPLNILFFCQKNPFSFCFSNAKSGGTVGKRIEDFFLSKERPVPLISIEFSI